MCSNIIIDTNRGHRFTKQKTEPLYADKMLNEYINNQDFKVVYSKDFSFKKDREDSNWNKKLEEWKKYGSAILNRENLSQLIKELKKSNKLKSDDPHIIALAQTTETRILYTGDSRLTKDFTNKEIMGNNDTKIYREEDRPEAIESFLNKHKCPNKN